MLSKGFDLTRRTARDFSSIFNLSSPSLGYGGTVAFKKATQNFNYWERIFINSN
jgi:hypothetical protein